MLPGKHFLLLIVVCAGCALSSCRKELLVQGPDNLKNALSISEAKSYFDSHLANSKKVTGGLSALSGHPTLQTIFANKQPVWDKAYQKMLSTGGAVKIPLDFGNVMQMVDGKKKSIVPLASLNYLLMYKDNKEVVHAEWVHLRPTKSWIYGKRQVYNGTVEIRDWNGKRLKTYRYGTAIKTGKNVKGMSVKNEEDSEEEELLECLIWPVREKCTCTAAWGGGNWNPNACDYCDICVDRFCQPETPPDCENCEDPPFNPPYTPPGGGETGDPGGNGGGGTGNGNGEPDPSGYPPNCNPDPNYVVPNYPAPEGLDWIMPCSDVPIPEVPESNDPYEGIDLSSAVRTLSLQLGLASGLAEWLEVQYQTQGNTVVANLTSYLAANSNSQDSRGFAKWAVGYLKENNDVDFETLSKNFAFNYEGGEEIYNENFWNNYSSPQKNSPSLSAMLAAYPHQIYQGKRMALTNTQIYALVGGQLNNKHLSGDPEYINACALRMSIALNKISGHEIPSSASSHTQNGKTYILGAQAMNSYLRKTYGTPSISSVGNTKLLDDYTNITDAIKGKNAIYSIVYKNDSYLTGHIDMIVSGTVIGALNIPLSQNQPNKNKIQKIDVWFLN